MFKKLAKVFFCQDGYCVPITEKKFHPFWIQAVRTTKCGKGRGVSVLSEGTVNGQSWGGASVQSEPLGLLVSSQWVSLDPARRLPYLRMWDSWHKAHVNGSGQYKEQVVLLGRPLSFSHTAFVIKCFTFRYIFQEQTGPAPTQMYWPEWKEICPSPRASQNRRFCIIISIASGFIFHSRAEQEANSLNYPPYINNDLLTVHVNIDCEK